MFERRLNVDVQIRKPKVLLDKRFPFTNALEVGDKGQLDAVLQMESESLEMNDVGDEIKHFTLKIEKAEPIIMKSGRI